MRSVLTILCLIALCSGTALAGQDRTILILSLIHI